jgi:NAD-dependent deacetylase
MKKHIVVLTGAGVSAESGIKTFRDTDGLWENYRIEEVATPQGWAANPQLVLDFYNLRRHDALKAQPNAAHYGLAEMEKDYQVTIITQNIDDLHERAGSTNVVHLHGEITKMRSVKNLHNLFPYDKDIQLGDKAPDGGQLRPHIVWFEEPVPMIEKAAAIATDADVFVVIGTSLQVYPAAGLVHYAPPFAPKYIIDKNIPSLEGYRNITAIELPATEGVKKLREILDESNSK